MEEAIFNKLITSLISMTRLSKPVISTISLLKKNKRIF